MPRPLATELRLGSTVFPDAPLTITGPGEESGTYDFFVEKVITPIALKRGNPALLDEAGKVSFTRPDYQPVRERPDHRRGRHRHP